MYVSIYICMNMNILLYIYMYLHIYTHMWSRFEPYHRFLHPTLAKMELGLPKIQLVQKRFSRRTFFIFWENFITKETRGF